MGSLKTTWGGDRRSKYKGQKTKTFRIPENMDGDALVSLRDDLESVVSAWETEANSPEHKTSPRYDACKRLLEELRGLLEGTQHEC
ncbi:hypothetical protein [uncultured Nostoc sp.]|uniref:hypothetical protein n=1 Tax=uncultured Nostoc sp. TaxID=340711 RepID=UPI0035C95FEF